MEIPQFDWRQPGSNAWHEIRTWCRGATVFSALLIIAIWLLTGLLVRYSFLGALSKAAERQLAKYVPDYDSYKAKAEERLQRKVRVLPYTSALIRWEDYWQPG